MQKKQRRRTGFEQIMNISSCKKKYFPPLARKKNSKRATQFTAVITGSQSVQLVGTLPRYALMCLRSRNWSRVGNQITLSVHPESKLIVLVFRLFGGVFLYKQTKHMQLIKRRCRKCSRQFCDIISKQLIRQCHMKTILVWWCLCFNRPSHFLSNFSVFLSSFLKIDVYCKKKTTKKTHRYEGLDINNRVLHILTWWYLAKMSWGHMLGVRAENGPPGAGV